MTQSGMVNITKHLKPQGLNPFGKYTAIVVDNNDPQKLLRIKARVPGLMDNIKDEHLPWANPYLHHVDGAKGGSAGSGIFYIPKKDTKVTLLFPTKDIHFPIWAGYTVDKMTKVPEMEKNYPNRVVIKLQNGWYMIIDTTTNEFFLNVPGDMNMTVLGNLNQYIVGNMQTSTIPAKGGINGYLNQNTVLNTLSPKPTDNVAFTGLIGKKGSAGNAHNKTQGNYSHEVTGDYKLKVGGKYDLEVGKDAKVKVTGTLRHEATRIENN